MKSPARLPIPGFVGWLLRRAVGAEAAATIEGDLAELAGRNSRSTPSRRQYWWLVSQLASCLTPSRVAAIRRQYGRPRVNRGPPMDNVLTDLRFALRTIRKAPAFAALVILTMACGIAATTVVYSAVDGLVLRPFPFPEPSRLIGIGTAFPKLGVPLGFMENLSPAEYLDAGRASSIERAVAWDMGNRQVTVGETTENLFSGFWWGDAFPTLGLAPFLGRGFTAEEIRKADRVAVLSYRVWRNRFGADSALVGSQIRVNGEPFQVIGIMAPRSLVYGMDLWIPMWAGPEVIPRNRRQFQVLARLAPNVSLERANAELDLIARQVEAEHGKALPEYGGWRMEAMTWNAVNVRQLEPAAYILLGSVAFVMLLVSTNVATLLLGRSSGRSREIALRTALGAGRRRILRQLLTESLLLALVGCALGVLLGNLGLSALNRTLESLPISAASELALNSRVLLVAVGAALVAGLAFGIVPALQSLRLDPQRTLQTESGGTTGHASRLRLQRVLIGVEAALAITLLAGGGYLVRSFLELRAVDPGFTPDRLLAMRLSLARERYSRERVEPFFATLRERVASIPGVRGVATVSQYPPSVFLRSELRIDGTALTASDQRPVAFMTLASPSYFETMGIPLKSGRSFSPADRPKTPWVAVVNDVLAAKYFPGQDPIGKRVQLGGKDNPWFEIVGTVGSTTNRGLDRAAEPEIFMSTLQADGFDNQLFLIVRTEGEPRIAVGSIRNVVRSIDPDQPVYGIQTIAEAFDRSQFNRRFSTILLGVFAGFALVLAAVGVYGVVGYAASRRTREVGVRIALGASGRSVARLFIRQALIPVLVGVACGLLAAFGIGRAMASLLFEVHAGDPATLAGAALLLGAIAVAAAYLPARRASKLDPVRALRSE